jgi:hypothetical protein
VPLHILTRVWWHGGVALDESSSQPGQPSGARTQRRGTRREQVLVRLAQRRAPVPLGLSAAARCRSCQACGRPGGSACRQCSAAVATLAKPASLSAAGEVVGGCWRGWRGSASEVVGGCRSGAVQLLVDLAGGHGDAVLHRHQLLLRATGGGGRAISVPGPLPGPGCGAPSQLRGTCK